MVSWSKTLELQQHVDMASADMRVYFQIYRLLHIMPYPACILFTSKYSFRVGDVTQVAECLPSMQGTLGLSPSTAYNRAWWHLCNLSH